MEHETFVIALAGILLTAIIVKISVWRPIWRKRKRRSKRSDCIPLDFYKVLAIPLRDFNVYFCYTRFDGNSKEFDIHADTEHLAEFAAAVRAAFEHRNSNLLLSINKLDGAPLGPPDTIGPRAAGWEGDVIVWTTEGGEEFMSRGWCNHPNGAAKTKSS